MKKWLPKTLLIASIVMGLAGFSDFGESMYWSLARPLSVVLFLVWLTHRLIAAECEMYEQDDYYRACCNARKKDVPKENDKPRKPVEPPGRETPLTAVSSH